MLRKISLPRNDSNHIIAFGVVVDGFKIGEAFSLDVPSCSTVNDVKVFLKSVIHLHPAYRNINIENLQLWRVLVPRPPYFHDDERLYRDVLLLNQVHIKCRLVESHEVGHVLNESNYPDRMMFAVIEICA
ncbi:MAG: hypothetical protein J3R72DRAFT_421180 [Linnemannia gamsii]|nr:MAG: hypothetical protein J3R72DRAFT_421180 [Linnemannia gamsii]